MNQEFQLQPTFCSGGLMLNTNTHSFAKFAKHLLAIPATSVPSERIFLTAGDVITASRASLKPKNVDMLIFLKKNTDLL